MVFKIRKSRNDYMFLSGYCIGYKSRELYFEKKFMEDNHSQHLFVAVWCA
jgi:hypothetical protein